MKDLIIPYILRDRIIMNMDEHCDSLTDKQKTEFIWEIVDTYLRLLAISEEQANIYTLFFSTSTNYSAFKWMIDRLNDSEDKVKVFNAIRHYSLSRNFEVLRKKEVSNILQWRFMQHPTLQKDLDRLIYILTGKTFIEIVTEIEQLNN